MNKNCCYCQHYLFCAFSVNIPDKGRLKRELNINNIGISLTGMLDLSIVDCQPNNMKQQQQQQHQKLTAAAV
jgi:hypothetical protein